MWKATLWLCAGALCGLFAQVGQEDPPPRPYPLMVGDPAPALAVGEWIRGEPDGGLQPGKTYVVEFWATWCPPCRAAIPHLTRLQARYAERDVRVIGVSVWEKEPESVRGFVEGVGDGMAYTVGVDLPGADGRGPAAASWMEAAGQSSIPTAFVVDEDGVIAWIGRAQDVEGPLAEIVSGKWDLAAATRNHAREMVQRKLLQEARLEVRRAQETGDWAAALAEIERAGAGMEDADRLLGIDRFTVLLRLARYAEAYAYGAELVSGALASDPGALNNLAWAIVDPASDWIREKDLALARRAAQRGCELTQWEDPLVLDTLALVLFEAGQVGKAIDLQKKALARVKGTAYEAEFRERLERFKAAGKR